MSGAHDGWDAVSGTAGGSTFGSALQRACEAQAVDPQGLARQARVSEEFLRTVFSGEGRVAPGIMSRLALALRLGAIEFLQRTEILSLAVYAGGLDPLFFLAEGPVRYDARIYMREINPRHPVPESDMMQRNPTLRQIRTDAQLDEAGKIEVELTYLLSVAVRDSGGAL